MPTYDYVCAACSHEFELFQHITENPVKKCPSCGKLKARRMIGTGGAILFKGKRRQAPPGIKVTSKAFGSGRRMPIAHKFIC